MDKVQFGRWMSERRRKSGFDSQRALVERIQNDSALGTLGITKDFLAHLEAGKFAQPFRGTVRRRLLALAWLLCETPRDVKSYLRAAELTELHPSEGEHVQLLREHLATRHSQRVLPLLPRPTRLIGRESIVRELVGATCSMRTGLYAITGMPGVGKSALASETLHLLAAHEQERLRVFPDGIAAFTCTGRQGTVGLLSLLDDIIAVFGPHASASFGALQDSDAELARVLDRARLALASKRVLLLLDDVEAQFPLRQALDALLGVNQHDIAHIREIGQTQRVVLTTSRYIFPPAFARHHLHLGPLESDAALELLTALIGHPLQGEALDAAKQVCTSVGGLPLAIEGAAAAYTVGGVSLSLLAAHASEHPLDALLDGAHELRSSLARAFKSVDPEVQQRFALLPMLGTSVFSLETASALGSTGTGAGAYASSHRDGIYCLSEQPAASHVNGIPADATASDAVGLPVEHLMSAASDLSQLVRHSLVECISPGLPVTTEQGSDTFKGSNLRYRLHPLTHAQAMKALGQLEPEDVQEARSNIHAYALAFVERYADELAYLEHECDFLLAALVRAFQAEHYADVLRFVEALAPLAGRLGRPRDGERLFSWGIQASRNLHDRYHQAHFVSELGWVYSQRGEFSRARQAWEESLEIATSLRQSVFVWKPLAHLAHLAHIQGECDAALQYTAMYLERCQESSNYIRTADTLSVQAFYKRLQGDSDGARRSLHLAMDAFAQHSPTQACSLADVIQLRIQLELARVQGDYAQSLVCVGKVAPLLQERSQYYLLADLLFDQACFAQQKGRYDDGRQLARRVIQVAEQVKVQHFYQRGIQLLQQFPEATLSQSDGSNETPT